MRRLGPKRKQSGATHSILCSPFLSCMRAATTSAFISRGCSLSWCEPHIRSAADWLRPVDRPHSFGCEPRVLQPPPHRRTPAGFCVRKKKHNRSTRVLRRARESANLDTQGVGIRVSTIRASSAGSPPVTALKERMRGIDCRLALQRHTAPLVRTSRETPLLKLACILNSVDDETSLPLLCSCRFPGLTGSRRPPSSGAQLVVVETCVPHPLLQRGAARVLVCREDFTLPPRRASWRCRHAVWRRTGTRHRSPGACSSVSWREVCTIDVNNRGRRAGAAQGRLTSPSLFPPNIGRS